MQTTKYCVSWLLLACVVGCGSSSSPGDESSGGALAASSGGSSSLTPSGGSKSGASGGATATLGTGGASGGATGSVSSGVAGSLAAGGSPTSGGSSTQATVASGGTTAKGGATSAGGTSAKGGATSAGGTSSKGGATSSGGTSSAGGATAKGGTTSTGGTTAKGGATSAGGTSSKGGATSSGGTSSAGGTTAKGGATSAGGTTSTSTSGVTLYGTPYANVNMWYGPVDFTESVYHNACGQNEGSKYPSLIQSLYGSYLIGLDGEHIANVANKCDTCAQLTANGMTIVARVITYGIENGVNAIDLSPEAQTALGLSGSNWTGTWQFSSCPTNGTPLYYEFDKRQWSPQNFWYMRIWTRNQRIPVTALETKIGTAAWATATQVSDGAWETPSGVDFSGGFQVRVTGVDGQQLVDSIPAPTGVNPSNPVAGHTNF